MFPKATEKVKSSLGQFPSSQWKIAKLSFFTVSSNKGVGSVKIHTQKGNPTSNNIYNCSPGNLHMGILASVQNCQVSTIILLYTGQENPIRINCLSFCFASHLPCTFLTLLIMLGKKVILAFLH